MEGGGSEGEATKLFSAYGFTKAGIPQLNKSLQQEIQARAPARWLPPPGQALSLLPAALRQRRLTAAAKPARRTRA